jgi:hypothetical protein
LPAVPAHVNSAPMAEGVREKLARRAAKSVIGKCSFMTRDIGIFIYY